MVEAWHQQSHQDLTHNAISPPPRHPQELHIKPESLPGAPKLLETRPRPLHSSAINRIRSIPKLVSANGIPFLRYHKKQSPFLTRVINDKRMTRTKRHETMNLMHAQGETGSVSWAEEVWDGLVEGASASDPDSSSGSLRSLGSAKPSLRSGGGRGEKLRNASKKDKRDGMGTWRESFLLSERHQSTMLNVEKARNRRYALKMTEILEEEKRLHDIEKGVVDREKRNKKRKEKRLRRTEEERRERREFLEGLGEEEREREVERFRRELAERKREAEKAKAEKKGSAKQFSKEELGEIARSDWGAPSGAPSATSAPPAISPTATVSPTSTPRLASGTKTEERRRLLDEKIIAIAEKSRVREVTKELAMGKKKASVAEAKSSAERGFTISWGRGRPDRERVDKVWPGQAEKSGR